MIKILMCLFMVGCASTRIDNFIVKQMADELYVIKYTGTQDAPTTRMRTTRNHAYDLCHELGFNDFVPINKNETIFYETMFGETMLYIRCIDTDRD